MRYCCDYSECKANITVTGDRYQMDKMAAEEGWLLLTIDEPWDEYDIMSYCPRHKYVSIVEEFKRQHPNFRTFIFGTVINEMAPDRLLTFRDAITESKKRNEDVATAIKETSK